MTRPAVVVMTASARAVYAHTVEGVLIAQASPQGLWWWVGDVMLCRRTVDVGEVRNALARFIFGRK